MSFVDELQKSGQLLFDSQVLPSPGVARFERRDGALAETELETAFTLAEFFVISAESHAGALAIAKRCPHYQVGPVGLRALDETVENAYP